MQLSPLIVQTRVIVAQTRVDAGLVRALAGQVSIVAVQAGMVVVQEGTAASHPSAAFSEPAAVSRRLTAFVSQVSMRGCGTADFTSEPKAGAFQTRACHALCVVAGMSTKGATISQPKGKRGTSAALGVGFITGQSPEGAAPSCRAPLGL